MKENEIFSIERKENISNLVANKLIDMIISRQFKPCEKLPTEKELSQAFGVGRTTIREAIRALNILGLVEVRVPDGMFVTNSPDNFYTRKMQMTSKYGYNNVIELTEARMSLECGIVRLAAIKATNEEIENLQNSFRHLVAAKDNNEKREWDAQFHMTIADISKNPFLKQSLLLLLDGIYDWIQKVEVEAPTEWEISTPQHEEIMKAIIAKDPDLAEQNMRTHMTFFGNIYLKIENAI